MAPLAVGATGLWGNGCRASNGRYRSVLHRATVSREKTRMSWPVFVEPRREYVVGPHPRLVAGEIPAKYDYKAKTFENYRYCRINKLPQ
uniref:Flavonol synthase/flavanone 3-hydroxylase n=1 Tax=Aegilops tauschii TaxID=37682 RepID=M8BHB6_AEGTA